LGAPADQTAGADVGETARPGCLDFPSGCALVSAGEFADAITEQYVLDAGS
jgi:hypothetical protein